MAGSSANFRIWRGFILTSALVGGLLAWGVGRGFDFTDEGVYYLSFAHPEEVSDFHTSYHLFGRVLFALTGHNIAFTRLLTGVVNLLGAAMFLWGLLRWKNSATPRVADDTGDIAIGLGVGAAFGLSFVSSPVAPSYNLLNAALLLAASGLLLASAAEDAVESSSVRRFFGFSTAAGLLLAIDFFVKFSTGIPLALSGGGFVLVASRAPWRRKLQLVALTALAGGLVAVVFFLGAQNFTVWKEGSTGLRTSLVQASFLEAYFGRYWAEWCEMIVATLRNYLPVFGAIGIGGLALIILRRRPNFQRVTAIVVGLAVVLTLIIAALQQQALERTDYHRIQFYLSLLMAVALSLGLSLLAVPRAELRIANHDWRTALLVGWLLLIPFLGAIGTTNDINANLFYQLAPWFAVLALGLGGIDHRWQSYWPSRIGTVLVCTVALYQFAHAFLDHPYRIPGPLRSQTEKTSIGIPASTLRLDPASHVFIEAARSQLVDHGFKPGDDIFAFFNLPGLVFAVGGISPGHPWYYSGDMRSLELDAIRVASVSAARRSRAFVVTNGSPELFLPLLKPAGLDFPAAYVRCGPSLQNPLTQEVVEIWVPKDRAPPPQR